MNDVVRAAHDWMTEHYGPAWQLELEAMMIWLRDKTMTVYSRDQPRDGPELIRVYEDIYLAVTNETPRKNPNLEGVEA